MRAKGTVQADVYRVSPGRTSDKQRNLRSEDLNANQVVIKTSTGAKLVERATLPDDDPIYLRTRELLFEDGYAGVILSGPPGTSKTWYALQIAAKLTEKDTERSRFIQFHSAYQYEDFIEGFVPTGDTFTLKPKHLMEMCSIALEHEPNACVLVIDELSRSDPGRVFGEALTYIETSRRGEQFTLASGTQFSIPPNLYFIATMNPQDRSVEALDVAFERRFAKLEMLPKLELLDDILRENGVPDDLSTEIRKLFLQLQGSSYEEAKIGHAYFRTVRDVDSLERLWEHQLRFSIKRALQLDKDAFDTLAKAWTSAIAKIRRNGANTAVSPVSEEQPQAVEQSSRDLFSEQES